MATDDVVVVGAGIVGLSAAYYLAKAGASVTVVDRFDVAAGTSGACDGNVMLQSKEPGPMLDIGLEASARYPGLIEELGEDVEYERHGSLILMESEDQVERMRPGIEATRAAGVEIRLLDHQAVADLQPEVAEHIVAGAYCPSDVTLNPLLMCFALARAAKRLGVKYRFGDPVREVVVTDGAAAGVRVGGDLLAAPNVVLAGGVWTPELLAPLGRTVPIKPRKGHIVVTEVCRPFVNTAMVSPSYLFDKHAHGGQRPAAGGGGVSVSFSLDQTVSGTMFIGSSREMGSDDVATASAVLRRIAVNAARIVPCLADVRVIRSFAGLRPVTPDGRPLIGAIGPRGLHIAAGHEGDGIALGPITGELVTELVLDGKASRDLTPFDPERFERAHETT
ncbi:MAG: FAD-dependent oxidoreductase [Actinomycetia bacterium]|nr:FAD-dependent oxidoreductase [Actinomycetes bacterium]